MSKKTFITEKGQGYDAAFFPRAEKAAAPTTGEVPEEIAESASTVSVLFRIPESLKIKLDTHCAQNRITKQQFLTNLIKNNIE
jgi:hypothetical protein